LNGLVTLENLFDYDDARNNKRNYVVDEGNYFDLRVEGKGKLKVGKEVPW
jgi:hypothetical protein